MNLRKKPVLSDSNNQGLNDKDIGTMQDKQNSNIAISQQVARLRTSFQNHITRPLAFRQQQLSGIARMLKEHETDIIAALHKDMGRPNLEAYTVDIAMTAAEITLMQKNLKRWAKPTKVRTDLAAQPGKSRIYHEPYGVVLIIAPWNYPIQLSLCPLVGAIAAGNCAIVKPSEFAPTCSALLHNLLPKYIDQECYLVVEGGIPETTALLEEQFDYIFYTGNPHVAKIVMQAAAKHLTPLTLELGGKSPCIVDKNTDIDLAARRILFGKFFNAGQTCIAPDYLLVHEEIKDALLQAFKKTLLKFYGNNPKQSKDFGRIINHQHHQRLMKLMQSGGEVFVGGDADASENYISPTILDKVQPNSAIMQEEIFGPLLPVITIKSIDEAILFINKRPKPLSLYLFSQNKNVQNKILAETSSGGACINHTTLQYLVSDLPFGGVGTSGLGSYHGKASFDTFSHHKSVLIKSMHLDVPLIYPPHHDGKKKWLKMLL